MNALTKTVPKGPASPWLRRVAWVLPLTVVGAGLYYLGSQQTLPAEAVHRATFRLQGQSNEVSALTFTADGSMAASACWGHYNAQTKTYGDGEIRLWDMATGKELATLRGHVRGAQSLAFTPDGRLLASGGVAIPDTPVEVKLWDVTRAAEVATFRGHTGRVTSLAFTPDGKALASGEAGAYDARDRAFKEAEIRLWDVALRKERAVLKSPAGEVSSLAFAPDGKTLASANRTRSKAPGDIKLWDVAPAAERATLKGHVGPVLCVAFSPDSQTLASGGEGRWVQDKHRPRYRYPTGEVKLWDVGTGRERVALEGHPEPRSAVSCVAFAPDGKGLASVGGYTVKLWDVNTGRERASFPGEMYTHWSNTWFTPNGLVLVSRNQSLVKLWDVSLKK